MAWGFNSQMTYSSSRSMLPEAPQTLPPTERQRVQVSEPKGNILIQTTTAMMLFIYLWVLGLISGSCACVASILCTEPPLGP